MKAPKTKSILINVWLPVLTKLNDKCERACLRRDAFLNNLFRVEIPKLDSEFSKPVSNRERTHSVRGLQELTRKPLNLALESEVVEMIVDVCQKKNIARDCFVNRLLFCLVMPRSTMQAIFDYRPYEEDIIAEHKWDFPGMRATGDALDTLIDVAADPFWFLRQCLEAKREDTGEEIDGIYSTWILPTLLAKQGIPTLHGLNIHHVGIDKSPPVLDAMKSLDHLLNGIADTTARRNETRHREKAAKKSRK